MTPKSASPIVPSGAKMMVGANQRDVWDELERRLSLVLDHEEEPGEVLAWLRSMLDATPEDHATSSRGPSTKSSTPDRRRHPQPGVDSPRHEFAWACPVSRQLYAQIQRISDVDSTVLLTGESGTGKTTIARMIHERSSRRGGPFVAVNCGSLPRDLIDAELFGHAKGAFTGAIESRPGQVEAADGGTLFLDEIGDLPLPLQPKLLTFLQERTFYRIGSNRLRQVDVRVISATHANLLELSETADFRRDLFFRLAVLRLQVPSLRQRRPEIRAMTTRILQRITKNHGTASYRIDEEAYRALEQYPWPGNIRELENVLENAAAFTDSETIHVRDLCLPSQSSSRPNTNNDSSAYLGKTLAEIEREAIICALQHSNGNKAQTARELGISLRSVYNKMHRYNLVVSKALSERHEQPLANRDSQ